jgi:hypothetical protein
MSPGVPVRNRLIMVLAMAPSGLCPPNSACSEVCRTVSFLLSKCDLSKMTSQWLPLSVKRVASATDEPFHQFIYTLSDTCCQIICCDFMEFDYFMMRKVSQWQHFWQFFILWIITIVQSPGVLKHNNQHHTNVANYQNQKIGQKKVFVHHKWNGHSFHLSRTDWQWKVWFCTWLIVEYTIMKLLHIFYHHTINIQEYHGCWDQ